MTSDARTKDRPMHSAIANDAFAKSAIIGEKNDCAVKAVAISTGIDYAIVHAEMARRGRRARRGTKLSIIRSTVYALGWRMVEKYNRRQLRGLSIKSIRNCLRRDTRYMVLTSRHILAVVDGVVEDWTEGRKHRPITVWEMVPAGRTQATFEKPVVVAPIKPRPVQPKRATSGRDQFGSRLGTVAARLNAAIIAAGAAGITPDVWATIADAPRTRAAIHGKYLVERGHATKTSDGRFVAVA